MTAAVSDETLALYEELAVTAPFASKALYDRAKKRVERYVRSKRSLYRAPRHIKIKNAMRS